LRKCYEQFICSLSVVAHVYNPGCSGGRDMEDHGLRPGGSWVKASPRQIVHETHGLKSAWAKSY
jgi:hypothetical protein